MNASFHFSFDPSKTEQLYEQEPAEREKPYFRVRIYNRE